MAHPARNKRRYPSRPWLYNCIVYFRENKQLVGKKWKVSNLLNFTAFLDKKHSAWLFYNVYTRKGIDPERGNQIANFTKNNRPKYKHIFGYGYF